MDNEKNNQEKQEKNDFKEEFDKKLDEITDTPEITGEFDSQDIEDNKIWAIIACFGITFWVPLLANSDSKFGRFWANQGLILLIVDVVMAALGGILSKIPVVGGILNTVADLIALVFLIFGIIYSAQGKAKEIPLVDGLFKIIK